MNKFRILLSLLVIAGAGFFALRHQTLRQARTEQEQLEQKLEQATNSALPAPAPVAVASPTHNGLSAAERSELLRLRGQVGPLRQEVAQATNELARIGRAPRAASPGATTEEPIVTREEAMQKMTRGKQWMLALILYAQEHEQRFPGTLPDAAPLAAPDLIERVDDFEFVRPGLDINSIKSPATTIVLREKQSWKTANGRWNRTYAFADGHIENAVSDSNDFTEWEAKHQPSENQGTGQ